MTKWRRIRRKEQCCIVEQNLLTETTNKCLPLFNYILEARAHFAPIPRFSQAARDSSAGDAFRLRWEARIWSLRELSGADQCDTMSGPSTASSFHKRSVVVAVRQ